MRCMAREIQLVRVAFSLVAVFVSTLSIGFLINAPAFADDPSRCASLFLTGKYAECASVAREAIARGDREEAWWLWGIRAELIRGRHDEAKELLETGLAKNSYAVRLRLLAHD